MISGQLIAYRTRMHTDLILNDPCHGDCSACLKARRMVSAVVTSVLNQMVEWLDRVDLESAEYCAAKFPRCVSEVPVSVRELVGADEIIELKTSIAEGLSMIKRGEVAAASTTFRLGLDNWYATYPAYRA
jgi:hypothetical protein